MNLSAHSKQAAWLFRDRIALKHGEQIWTYAQVDALVDRLASALAERYRPLARVGVMMSNRPEAVFLQFALERSGLVRVPVNARYTGNELAVLMVDCDASAVFFDAACRQAVLDAGSQAAFEAVRVDEDGEGGLFRQMLACPVQEDRLGRAQDDDLATINYTSGTTGKPKGVMLTHRNWAAVYRNMLVDRDIRGDDIVAYVGPLTHSAGAYLAPWYWRGATNVIVTPPSPEALLDVIEQESITVFTCVPTFLTRLLAVPGVHDRKLGSIRMIGYGAEPIPVNTLDKSWALFGPVLWQNYGQTEAMMTCLHLPPADHVAETGNGQPVLRQGYVGRPYTFVEVVLRQPDGTPVGEGAVGEITLRGDHIMQGYWNRPDLTRETVRDGWLWTGDLAVCDGPGLIRLVGRRKDMLICGGFNIYPAELEALLTGVAGIREAAVVARDDPEWGEIAVAFVALDADSRLSIEQLVALVRPMAGIKTPKAWHIVDELPKNPNGKLDKRILKEWDHLSLKTQEEE